MPPEFVAHARDRLVAVNLAYETLTGQRRAPRLTAARPGP
jgi:hypothetical protein